MKNRLFLNIDINSVTTPFLNAVAEFDSPTAEDLYPFMDIYLNTQITDVLINNFCQFSLTPSKVFSSSSDIYLRTVENGVPCDHKEKHKGIHKLLTEYGLDAYGIWVDRCNQTGLKPWMTIRMNDCHCPDDITCFLRSDFFYEARDNGWNIGKQYGYYRYCFDYAVPEVRQKMLDYIEEQLDRYDVGGLELDFMREPYCFDYINNKNCIPIMNDFIRNVKKIVTEAEKKHGHKIEISARLMRDIDQNLVLGFDARTWAREGLVDSITPTPRWDTIDSDMPLAVWKKELPQIDIFAGMESNTYNLGSDVPTILGFAANYLTDGVDGINLYNQFVNPHTPPEYLVGRKEIFSTCASLETLKDKKLRHVQTFQDTCPLGCEHFRPLPLTVENNEKKTLPIKTSSLSFRKSGRVVFGIVDCDIEDVCVEFEGKPLSPSLTKGYFYSKNENVKYYSAPTGANNEVYKNIAFSSVNGKKITIYYAEIDI